MHGLQRRERIGRQRFVEHDNAHAIRILVQREPRAAELVDALETFFRATRDRSARSASTTIPQSFHASDLPSSSTKCAAVKSCGGSISVP